ncbi:hypothetical protein MKX03_027129 [Papaver bracteatum]|nr:hypothetical protein MKX03_027129 [Papaver bracteatum]
MYDVICWEKKIVGYLYLPNVIAAVQLPDDLFSQLQIPRMKQHDSNQNNPENMTDVFAGSHPGDGGAGSSFHENLASTTRGHIERRNFKVINNVFEKKLKQCYSVESSLNDLPLGYSEHNGWKKVTEFESFEEPKSAATSGIKKSRLEVNHVLLEAVGAINHALINTKHSISDKSITWRQMQFSVLPMWFLIPANYPLYTPVLLDCLHDSQSHDYTYKYLLADAKNKFYQSLFWNPEITTLTEMAESWDSCADAAFSEYSRRTEK